MKHVLYFGLLVCLLIGAAVLYELSLAPAKVVPDILVTEPVISEEEVSEDVSTSSVGVADEIEDVVTTTSGFATLEVPYEQADITILLSSIIEDSRCPTDVTCIQAGTVRVRGILTAPGGDMSERTFVLREPLEFAGRQVTLTDVLPRPVSTRTTLAGGYEFYFTVE